MAKFSEKTINEISSGNETVYAQELMYGTDNYWNINMTDTVTGSPYDLTLWTFSFRLVRRSVDAIVNGRNGIELEGLKRIPRETEINLDTSVKVYDPLNGKVRLLLDDSFFSAIPTVLDSDKPVCYTGYFSATLPSSGTVGTDNYIPPQTKKVLLLFIVRSDGVNA
jgi:hypothetical protein